jgi:geranylgeranyl diphosphate synthase type II
MPTAVNAGGDISRPGAGMEAVESYLRDCRTWTLEEIKRRVPQDTRHTAGLYELILDYPMRPAKALRPALCIATCLGLGGDLDAALPSAAAFELYHNAFLVHDDVEDASALRRHGPTLHTVYGVPTAVNVGDGMLAVAFDPLLDNVRVLGLGPALRILTIFRRMARESAEGQNLELAWIRERRWDLRDREYVRMVHKKTGWYSFISPVQVGAVAAGASRDRVEALGRFALTLGVAFQIQDDLLSLQSTELEMGKDALGDLWEGKYTLPLLHALRVLSEVERSEALAILARPRGEGSAEQRRARAVAHEDNARLFAKLQSVVELSRSERETLEAALLGSSAGLRTEADVQRLHALVTGRGGESLAHARRFAERLARRSRDVLDRQLADVPASVHKQFLEGLVEFVIRRTT